MKYIIPFFFAALAGCSSAPDADDIRSELEQGWAGCQGIKVIDLKKTNGIDNGGTYQMSVSWKFKLLKDMVHNPNSDQGGMDLGLCSDIGNSSNLFLVAMRDPKFSQRGGLLKKGDTIDISDVFTMVKSEKGWILK